jgi:hypothetical protein
MYGFSAHEFPQWIVCIVSVAKSGYAYFGQCTWKMAQTLNKGGEASESLYSQ